MYTLFQVMTGESWSEAVARPLMFGLYKNAFLVSIYFVSFILLMQIVLTNVVVAVLLDKFVADESKADDGDEGGDSSVAVAPEEFLTNADFSTSGDDESVKPAAAWPADNEHSPTCESEKLGNGHVISYPSLSPRVGSGDRLDATLELILQELAALRKEVATLKQQQDGSGLAAVDVP